MSVTVQLSPRRARRCQLRSTTRSASSRSRRTRRTAGRAAAAAAGEPHVGRRPAVRRRRHLRAVHQRHASSSPRSAGSQAQCIFDGYVLSWQLHLDRTSTSSTIDIWAQDASLADEPRRHRDANGQGMTDGEVANAIFASYGFTPAAGNTDDDSPAHDPDGHTPAPARHRPAVPARARPARRQALPGRLHRHPGRPYRLLRDASRRRPAGGDDLAARPGAAGRSTRSTSTGT